ISRPREMQRAYRDEMPLARLVQIALDLREHLGMPRPDEFVLELLRARHLVVVAARDLEHEAGIAELPRADHAGDLLVGEAALEREERAFEELERLVLGERVHEPDLLVDALDLDDLLQVALG